MSAYEAMEERLRVARMATDVARERANKAEKERDEARMALHNFASLHLPPEDGKPHRVADEDGLAWVKVLVQSAHPNTPCRLQVGFVRSLLDRLEEAERNRDELAEILALDEPEDEEPPCNDGPLLVGLNKLLKDAEAQRDEHLKNWQAAITEVDRVRQERDQAQAAEQELERWRSGEADGE